MQRIILSSDSTRISFLFLLLASTFTGLNAGSLTQANQPSAFVGSGSCTECHQNEYAEWQQSDHQKAMQAIEVASKRWPNNIDLSFLQVSYMEKTGITDGIHRYLALLASVASQNPQVKTWMKKYGAAGNS